MSAFRKNTLVTMRQIPQLIDLHACFDRARILSLANRAVFTYACHNYKSMKQVYTISSPQATSFPYTLFNANLAYPFTLHIDLPAKQFIHTKCICYCKRANWMPSRATHIYADTHRITFACG